MGQVSVLMVGADVGVGVGDIGQSFLASNRFSGVDPQVGPGGTLSDWGTGYVLKQWMVRVNGRISFILGSSS